MRRLSIDIKDSDLDAEIPPFAFEIIEWTKIECAKCSGYLADGDEEERCCIQRVWNHCTGGR